MQLNHLNLSVADVPASRDFFVRFFRFRSLQPNDALSILEDEAGFVLTLMRAKPGDDLAYPGSFHVGFYVDEPSVHTMHADLTDAGFEPGEITTIHRGTMFYVTSPNGILVEICCPR